MESAAQSTAHQSTLDITHELQLKMYQVELMTTAIEQRTATLNALKRERAALESEIVGMQSTIAKR